jgi:hypothetical protein
VKETITWISVEDRLPTKDEYRSHVFLTASDSGGLFIATYDGEVWTDYDDYTIGHITHWTIVKGPKQ